MDNRAMMKLCATLLLSDNIPFPEKSAALAENPSFLYVQQCFCWQGFYSAAILPVCSYLLALFFQLSF